MNFKNRFKKLGFSLMEILIAVFIVAILALVTMPVFNKQINKADEYSYYLAYKTVEKIAGQIVALGDPEEITAYSLPAEPTFVAKNDKKPDFKSIFANNPLSKMASTVADKFAYTQTYILSKFVPKSVAASVTTSTRIQAFGGWSSEDYDEVWASYQYCSNGYKFPKKTITTTSTDANGQQVTNSTTEYYEDDDFECVGVSKNAIALDGDDNPTKANDVIAERFFSGEVEKVCTNHSGNSSIASFLKTQKIATEDGGIKPNASAFCEKFKTYCRHGGKLTVDGVENTMIVDYETLGDVDGEGSEEDDEAGDDDDTTQAGEEVYYDLPTTDADKQGYCSIKGSYTVEVYDSDEEQYKSDKPEFGPEWCYAQGGYNQYTENIDAVNSPTGKSDTINCQCKSGYVVSTNHEKFCVQDCPKGSLPYAKTTKKADGTVLYSSNICCSTDFNENTNKCCPEKSVYNPTSGQCECVSGFEMKSGVCNLVYCPTGSHKTDDGVCVVNPPIIKGKRLCEEIAKHWNVNEEVTNCNTFQTVGTSGVYHAYPQVYSAALNKDDATKYMSVNSKPNAFKDLAPNIELSNGLKLWILGDKAASIPALSYYSNKISIAQNMCAKKKLTSNKDIACFNEGGYFCKHENTCLMIDKSNDAGGVKDARMCCSVPDISDLQEEAKANGPAHEDDWKKDQRVYGIAGFTIFVDINGDRGDGTLWDDVFPFYIGANGTVYPGYPLDAPKASTGQAREILLYSGGNSDIDLPVDVYYYTSSDLGRERKVAFSGVSFARGMCSARRINKYTPYCMNLGEKYHGGNGFTTSNCPTAGGCTSSTTLNGAGYIAQDGKASRNPCDHYNCFVSVRKRLKSF